MAVKVILRLGGLTTAGTDGTRELGSEEESVPIKKKRHELLAVRAGRPVTQTTPGLEECVFHLHNRNKYTIA